MHLTLPWDHMEEASEQLANTEESRGKRRKASWREPIISRNNTTSDKQSMFQDNCCLLTAIWQTSKACPTPLSSRNSRNKPTSTPYTQPSCPSPSLILPCLRHNAICMCPSHRRSSNSFFPRRKSSNLQREKNTVKASLHQLFDSSPSPQELNLRNSNRITSSHHLHTNILIQSFLHWYAQEGNIRVKTKSQRCLSGSA